MSRETSSMAADDERGWRLGSAVDAFEAALKTSQRPQINDFLDMVHADDRKELMQELIKVDVDHRRRLGERPTEDDYYDLIRAELGDSTLIVGLFDDKDVRQNQQPRQDQEVEPSFRAPVGFGGYEYSEKTKLGAGGFGAVYRAVDPQLGRCVALKFNTENSEQDRILLRNEGRALVKLEHPHIVKVHHFEEYCGCSVLVLELIENTDLDPTKSPDLEKWLASGPRRAWFEKAQIARDVADAMAHALSKGFIHRDLKPANILIDKNGRAHVADFGLAIHEHDQGSQRGQWAGTFQYMSPEQVRGDIESMDGRSDIWALGVILYKMLTATLPFEGETRDALSKQVLTSPPRPPRQRDPDVPSELERICLKCLEKDVNDRYASFADLRDDLTVWLDKSGRTKVMKLPYGSLGDLFKGRERLLEQLRHMLQQSDATGATSTVCVAVHGLGGVGKTRLAVEYAYRHAKLYSAVLFVEAATVEDLNHNLSELVGHDFFGLPEQSLSEERARVAASLRWLQANPGWLLIVDNVDSKEAAEAIENLLGRLHAGHVLITSRLGEWTAGVKSYAVDVIAVEVACQFLLERTQSRRRELGCDGEDALTLAKELGGLPLALEQAAAYIAHHRASIAEYLQAWWSHIAEVQQWYDPRLMKYPRSLAVTWQTTMAQLDAWAVGLLNILAWMSQEPFPLFALDEERMHSPWWMAALYTAGEPIGLLSGDLREAILSLEGHSMIRLDTTVGTISMHTVVREILRSQEPTPEFFRTATIKILKDAIPSALNFDPWQRCEQLSPHVSAAVDGEAWRFANKDVVGLMYWLGRFLTQKAEYGRAEPVLRRAVALAPADEKAKLSLAQLLLTTGRADESVTLARQVFNMTTETYHPSSSWCLDAMQTFATTLVDAGRFDEGEDLLKRALEVSAAFYGGDSIEFADSCRAAGNALNFREDVDAAHLLRTALEIFQSNNWAERVANVSRELASVLFGSNRFDEAEPLLRESLKLRKREFSDDHPMVADVKYMLGQLLMETGRPQEAEPLLREALDVIAQVWGARDNRLADILAEYAQLLVDSGRFGDAEGVLRRNIAIYDATDASTSEWILEGRLGPCLSQLGVLLFLADQFYEAELPLRRSLEFFVNRDGAESNNAAQAECNLGRCLAAQGNRLDEAEAFIRSGLEKKERIWGRSHLQTVEGLSALSYLLAITQRCDQAEPLLVCALGIVERDIGVDSESAASGRTDLAHVLSELNRNDEAESAFRCALSTYRKVCPADNCNVAQAMSNLAIHLQKVDKSDEAESLFASALDMLERVWGPEHPNVATNLHRMASLLMEKEQHREAEPLLRRALTVYQKAFATDSPQVEACLADLRKLNQNANLHSVHGSPDGTRSP